MYKEWIKVMKEACDNTDANKIKVQKKEKGKIVNLKGKKQDIDQREEMDVKKWNGGKKEKRNQKGKKGKENLEDKKTKRTPKGKKAKNKD